jgi:hypothetical protein
MRSTFHTRSSRPHHRHFNLISYGDWGELFLTSLDGARSLLSYYCDHGISNNKDYQVARFAGALKLQLQRSGSKSSRVFYLAHAGGSGHIRQTGHFLNGTEARAASRRGASTASLPYPMGSIALTPWLL